MRRYQNCIAPGNSLKLCRWHNARWRSRRKRSVPTTRLVATSLNNLSALYVQLGRYADAEPLDKRALAIREKVRGPGHPDVAASLSNLASLYDSQGRYGDAEPLLKRALAIKEKAVGPSHPDVAISLNNLALFYQARGGRRREASTHAIAIKRMQNV